MNRNTGSKLVKWIFFSGAAALLLAAPLLVRDFYYRNLITLILINVAMAEGLWLMMQAGEESFGQSAFAAVGGYSTAILAVQHGVDPWFTFLVGGIAAALVAILLGLVISHLDGIYFVIGTFAFMELVRGLVTNFQQPFGGASGIVGVPAPAGLETVFGDLGVGFYYLALAVMVITLLGVVAVMHSRLGLLFRAVQQNRTLSSSTGISVRKYKLQAFAIGCFFTGLAGAVFASFSTQVSPAAFGFLSSLDIVLFIYVGGVASMAGPVIGAAVMTYLSYSLMSFGYLKMIIYGAILTVSILCLRGGLVSVPHMVLGLVKRFGGKEEVKAELKHV